MYIIQTPFYKTGFWSLVLHSTIDSDGYDANSKTCGILQADKDADFAFIFDSVRIRAAKSGPHPMLLPLPLFLAHFEMTSEIFRSILGDIADVDSKILHELDHRSGPEEASKLHRNISMKLHMCSMELAELGRRTKFEEELAARLMEDLQGHADLKLLIAMFSSMSKSRKPDIEELPGKVEGLRNVVSDSV